MKTLKDLPRHIQSRYAIGNAMKSNGFVSAEMPWGRRYDASDRKDFWRDLEGFTQLQPSGNGITINLRF